MIQDYRLWLRSVMYVKWRTFLAYFRFSKSAVCEMSAGRGLHDDFHDYQDEDELAPPMHEYTYTCSRCGKEFMI